MTAVLRVNLCKTENLRIGKRTTILFLQAVKIFNLLWAKSQTFLLIILLQIIHILNGLGLDVNSKNVLVQAIIHTLQHLVVLGILRVDSKVLLYTRNAAEAHILCNLNGIFAAWTNIVALKLLGI